MSEFILIEIIAVPAEQSRGRHNPRAVKRKLSNFPTKARAAPAPHQVFYYDDLIRIVAPAAPPDPARAPAAAPEIPPKRCRKRRRGTRALPRSGASTFAPGAPAACRAPPTAKTTA